jgi:cytochrome c-type biogenesis protein CcmH
MTLWLVFALMTTAAIFAVLWPLSRRGDSVSAGNDILVYRDQLDEIGRDRAAGRIGDAEAEAARVEVSRRLLAAADRTTQDPTVASVWGRRGVALAALILLPLAAGALYLVLGSPLLPAQPLSARLGAEGNPPIARLIAQVEAHLERDPKDGRGWEVLAPVYMQLGRYDEAAKAWRNAVTYNGSSVERETNLGQALVAAANGVVTAEAKQAFDRALALDASDPKARYFLGLAAAQDGRQAEAAAIWRALLAAAPPEAAWANFVREALAQVEHTPMASSAGPSGEDVAAASNLAPEQRQQMIAAMVERLADRLKSDGADFEGWLQLVRSYTVLGERGKAQSAAADARRAVAGDPDKLRQLDDLVKGLGLEG